jgi:dipeptidyl aminopeptidase/acylaminoacyl peptidase
MWKRLLPRMLFALAAAWVILAAGLSFIYTRGLFYPGCPPPQPTPQGFVDIQLQTEDGLTLNGWWAAPRNGAVILLLSGHGGNRSSLAHEAAFLASAGYGVLSLDTRSCAGEKTTLGWYEARDLRAMRDFALAQPGVEWLAAIGFSAGGTAAILGAVDMPEIEAVIAEGNYANLAAEITFTPAGLLSLEWLIQRFTLLIYSLESGVWPGRVSPIDALPRICPRPLLLIHGEYEIERSRGEQQAASAHCARLWVVSGAGHGEYASAQTQTYRQTVLRFLEQARQTIGAPSP